MKAVIYHQIKTTGNNVNVFDVLLGIDVAKLINLLFSHSESIGEIGEDSARIYGLRFNAGDGHLFFSYTTRQTDRHSWDLH